MFNSHRIVGTYENAPLRCLQLSKVPIYCLAYINIEFSVAGWPVEDSNPRLSTYDHCVTHYFNYMYFVFALYSGNYGHFSMTENYSTLARNHQPPDELYHGLSTRKGDNPRAKSPGLSPRTGG